MPVAALIPFLGIAEKVIDKLFPSPEAKAKAKLKLMELDQAGAFKEAEVQLERDLEQIKLNAVEAASSSVFKSGWRPFIGWTCGGGLFYQFLFRPISEYSLKVSAWFMEKDLTSFPIPPALDIDTLLTLLFGMLGLGVYRTYEKVKGKN